MHRFARIAAFAACLMAGLPGFALASGWGCKLWAATTYVAPLSESQQTVGGVTAAVRASNELGYQFGVEFRGGLLGFAFDYLHARQELERAGSGLLGTAAFEPISATLYLHLPTPVLELHGGPTVSYVNWGDLDQRSGSSQPIDAKLGYGISLGADLPIAASIAVVGGMRWLKLEAKPKGSAAIAVDPLISHIGLALRF